MKLYSNKFRWKIILIGIALIVIVLSLFYSNRLISKIHQKETEKAKQWAETIRKKGELVSLTNQIFNELREKEKQQAQLILEAQMLISEKMDLTKNVDVEFAQQVIKSNRTIPIAYLSGDDIAQCINIDTNGRKDEIRSFIEECRKQERSKKIEIADDIFMEFIYGESTELVRLNKESDSLLESFNKELLNNDYLIPLILMDKSNSTIITTNISSAEWNNMGMEKYLKEFPYDPISFDFGSGEILLYYKDSKEVVYLKWYPSIQFVIVGLVVFMAYFIFSTYRKAEQNQVWAGMAKETAHQLGTPLSSLMAWMDHLEGKGVDKMTLAEMSKDLDRLSKITDRFSKIGSETRLEKKNLIDTINQSTQYLKSRLSQKIAIQFYAQNEEVLVHHNVQLIEWVIENICKNAVDSMKGVGLIEITLQEKSSAIVLDIKDEGSGLSRSQYKTVFEPGYSTKKRGWGLGLTLVKRIIEEYHKGKVFVHKSELRKGTTFRIVLTK